MAAGLRELRRRRQSVMATKKITKAMELIASSRIIKAQQAAARALPYTRELNRAVSAVATYSQLDHPLTEPYDTVDRVAVLYITSDRGMNGAYSSNAIRAADRLIQRLRDEGKDPVRYVVGRKGVAHLSFRKLDLEDHWEGFSDSPKYSDAVAIADRLVDDFLKSSKHGGVDEIWVVYTRMESMISQVPRARRILPLEVVEGVHEVGESDIIPQYSFEPTPEKVLDALLPLYVRSRIWFYLQQCAASQLAAQQRAMKSATDNAEELIQTLTRQANQARQAEITQEISEIVGGAGALSEQA
ncbi:MAG: F0F1 ATP synthase subunit gamma [Propionibacteriaceae bacterium]|nr:F0F1 ATP synthase subunit gamma [Propionibacteriaceae bacterium]